MIAMEFNHRILTALVLIAASASLATVASADGTLIRWHKMGEQEGGANNAAVFQTLDSPVDGGDIQALDLDGLNTPTYRTIVGRPDGGGGIGIEFNAAQMENVSGFPLNRPSDSALSEDQGGLYDLEGITARSMQFWVRPTSAVAQSLVLDSSQHGARINSSGNFSMRYAGSDYDSTTAAAPNTWYHVEVVRPGLVSARSRMYVNGVAVAVSAPVDYAIDANFLTVGSNTAGNGEFFSGVIDELKFTVYGITFNAAAIHYGTYNFASENDYADFRLTGVAGDLNHSGSLTQADKDAFIAGWMDKKIINGLQIGDLQTYSQGDINFDGITNIHDLVLMQDALSGAGVSPITANDLSGVPEPAAAALLLLAMAGTSLLTRRHLRTLG
jgi:hypothetical protein